MKKIMIIALTGLTAFACQKQELQVADPAPETVTVDLESNKTFVYQLSTAPENVQISSDASHAALSRVAIVPGTSTSSTYQYVPDSTFTGTDEVTILLGYAPSANGCHHQSAPPPPPRCGGEKPQGPPLGKEKCNKDKCNGSKPKPAGKTVTFKIHVTRTASTN
jgi:hypothetical protein